MMPVRTVRRTLGPTCRLIAAVALALAAAGCNSEPTLDNPHLIAADDYRSTFDASVLVLRDYGFFIERQDYRFGRITSKPRPSPIAAQVWRRDNRTFDQVLSSTLNDQRRVVTINLLPTDSTKPTGSAAYTLQVQVDLERLSDNLRRLTGAMDGYAIARNLFDRPEELRRANVPGRKHYVLERDELMEQRMLADILNQAAELRTRAAPAESTEPTASR